MKIAEVKEVILDMYLSYNSQNRKCKQTIALSKVLSILDQIMTIARRRNLDI